MVAGVQSLPDEIMINAVVKKSKASSTAGTRKEKRMSIACGTKIEKFPPMVQVAETVYQSRPPLISGTEGELAMKKSREDIL